MKSFILVLAVVITFVQSGCGFITPAKQYPLKSESEVKKSTFMKSDGTSKTFLCGWAAVNEVGSGAWVALHNFNKAIHCNVEFEITERELVGKLVNPSKPNDPKSWKPIISIPITSHYYIENEKDAYGRETNKIIKNSSRSHFSARPYMELDFKGIRIRDWAYDLSPSWANPSVFDVRDIEWDKEKNFFAFTTSISLSPSYYSSGQVDYRFNFLEFKHNKNFDRTPYNNKNAKHINVLHVLGEKADGIYPILYAAKWDLDKRHDICPHEVPHNKIDIVKESVKLWNQALIEIGALDQESYNSGKKGFFINESKKMNYAFDLRCSSIAWVDDKEISERSPLGIAISLSDLRNGEMLWGQVVIYGGVIEHYLKNNMPISEVSDISSMNMDLSALFRNGFILDSRNIKLPEDFNLLNKINLTERVNDLFAREFSSNFAVLPKMYLENDKFNELMEDIIDAPRVSGIHQVDKNLLRNATGSMLSDLNKIIQSKTFELNRKLDLHDPYKLLGFDKSLFHSKNNQELFTKSLYSTINPGIVLDLDRTIMDILPSFRSKLQEEGVDDRRAMESFYKELILHEFGHFFGLGHNFKDNILPDPQKVPIKIYNSLKDKANAEHGYANFTTVMGYRHPYATIATRPEDIKPGIHDLHVLRYIYNKEYPVYIKGQDEFKYFKLPYADGIIPNSTFDPDTRKTFPIAYLPACNDLDATFSFDAECNRHAYGYNAETIVESYLNSIKDNIVQTLVASTDYRGGNSFLREFYLTYASWTILGRIRLFYDEMRRKYEDEIKLISSDEQSLYDFAESCEKDLHEIKNKKLYEIFSNNPELKELCKVNGRVVKELSGFLSKPLVDFTKYDFSNRYASGGILAGDADYDYSRVFGSWKMLSNMPLKIAALGTLTSPRPLSLLRTSAGYSLQTVPGYDVDKDAAYSYSTLYPILFTKAVSQAVENNLKLANFSNDYSTMGQSVLSLGYFLTNDQFSNDAKKFNEGLISNIRSQQSFNFTLAAVLLSKIPNPDKPSLAKKFTASIYDFRSGRSHNASEVYVLPKGEVLVRSDKNFLYTITRLNFISDSMAYVFAYKLDYETEPGDRLAEISVKKTLKDLYNRLLNACIVGVPGPDEKNNGLETFFGTDKFEGFLIPEGIASNELKNDAFLTSVDEGFLSYYESDYSLIPERNTCLEAKRGVGLIVSTAAILNGYWLPETLDFINK